jgi:hypothetical protein
MPILAQKRNIIIMKIELKEKNIIKVCELEIYTGKSKYLWSPIWNDTLSVDYLKKEIGRCYFIVVNDEIYKIGFSDCKKGIFGTINDGYKGAGNGGSPSIRTHGIHILIAEELLKGNKVEFYCQYIEEIQVEVELPLFDGSTKKVKTSLSGKVLEEANRELFVEVAGKFPIWNLQESSTKWPEYLQESLRELKSSKKSVTLNELRNR